jgi:hypothetical protein
MYIMFNPVFHTRNKYIEFELSFYAWTSCSWTSHY